VTSVNIFTLHNQLPNPKNGCNDHLSIVFQDFIDIFLFLRERIKLGGESVVISSVRAPGRFSRRNSYVWSIFLGLKVTFEL
jgi:hypothetical protein